MDGRGACCLIGCRVAELEEPMVAFPATVGINGEEARQQFYWATPMRTVRMIGLTFRTEHGFEYPDRIVYSKLRTGDVYSSFAFFFCSPTADRRRASTHDADLVEARTSEPRPVEKLLAVQDQGRTRHSCWDTPPAQWITT